VTATALITGAHGFIGRNLAVRLAERDDFRILVCTRATTTPELAGMVAAADVVFHLAGVNRPETVGEFHAGNADFTERLTDLIRHTGRTPLVVFSSSIQAEQDNPYGRSKLEAEEVLRRFAGETGARVALFRLPNVFGKWSRPGYNSVVATFCHNIAGDLPIAISDPQRVLDLVCVDDVVDAFIGVADGTITEGPDHMVRGSIPSSRITLGDLAARIRDFRDMRRTLMVPDLSERFTRQLYAMYLSYLEPKHWEYGLGRRSDDRGELAEFIKSPWFGQVFVSRTHPGITRGNHYHHTKTEKFFVIAGEGLVRFRPVEGDEVIEFVVKGEDYRVIDIPPGYTHSITNVGKHEMITLFWASEVFDPERPDTHFLPVITPAQEPE
jgi:UDP-2-acetamido-2,6-beta-L-arabino-hexul-4-ose reductase